MHNLIHDTNIIFKNKFDFTEDQFAEFIKFLTQNEDLTQTFWRSTDSACLRFISLSTEAAYYKDDIIGLTIFKSLTTYKS